MPNALTAHARARAFERLPMDERAVEEVLHRAASNRGQSRVPLWVKASGKHEGKHVGAVVLKAWFPHATRPGWQRERLVAFPIVRSRGQDWLVTCVLGPYNGRERMKP